MGDEQYSINVEVRNTDGVVDRREYTCFSRDLVMLMFQECGDAIYALRKDYKSPQRLSIFYIKKEDGEIRGLVYTGSEEKRAKAAEKFKAAGVLMLTHEVTMAPVAAKLLAFKHAAVMMREISSSWLK